MAASLSLSGASSGRLVGLISLGHFHSHFCAFALPPLFPLLKDAFGVGYVELGSLMALWSITSGLGQTPMGLLVDRIGGRAVLLAGVALQSIAFAAMGTAEAYWQLAVLAVVAGLANSVFHPADYAILSARIAKSHLGRAISFHSFSGYVGWALAPATMLGVASFAGWRGALVAVGVIGLAITLLIVWQIGLAAREDGDARAGSETQSAAARSFDLVRSRPLVLMLVFFFVSTIAGSGLQSFGAVALMATFGLDIVAANGAVTAFLVASAIGVLAGGRIVDRSRRHAALTALALAAMAACTAVIPIGMLPLIAVIALMAGAGISYGVISPLRDMQVRAVTPDGLVGVAFGFVSTGLGFGSAAAPLLCGWIMDFGRPDVVFYVLALMALASVISILAERQPAG